MKRLLLIALLTGTASTAFGAARYWVGGGSTPNWTATVNTNWGSASNTRDNASVPGATDDVFFDGVGFGDNPSTISANISIQSLNMTGYTNTLFVGFSNVINLTITGNGVTCKLAGTWTPIQPATGLGTLTFSGTSGTNLLTTGGGTKIRNITFSGVGGNTQFQDAVSLSANFNHNNGGVDLDSQTVTVQTFNESGSSARVLSMGTSSITVNGGAITGATNFTIAPNTATMWYKAAVQFGALNWNGTSVILSGDNVTINTSATIAGLAINNAGAATGLKFGAGGSPLTVTGSITTNGSAGSLAKIASAASGKTATISKASGVVCLDYLSFQDITGSGGATFDVGAHSTDVSGNSGLVFVTCGVGCIPPYCGIIGGKTL